MLRMIGHKIQKGVYEGNLHIYCHKDLSEGLISMCKFMLPPRLLPLFGDRMIFHCLTDGMEFNILGRPTVFFDTHSKKVTQYGLKATLLNGKQFTYLGDEPFRPECRPYVENVDYLMHEAMCLESQTDRYNPHRIQHSTVKDAALCAEDLKVKNLILHHTEDRQLDVRKKLYTEEAGEYFSGTVYMPDDLDQIIL